MKIAKIKNYIFDISLIIFLFLTLFVPNKYTKAAIVLILLVYAIICKIIHKKGKIVQTNSKKVSIIMLVIGILYIIAFYAIGIYTGYYFATVKFGKIAIHRYILPFSIIIIALEILRYSLISQERKYSKVTTFIITVLTDVILYAQIYDLSVLNDFLIVVRLYFICVLRQQFII